MSWSSSLKSAFCQVVWPKACAGTPKLLRLSSQYALGCWCRLRGLCSRDSDGPRLPPSPPLARPRNTPVLLTASSRAERSAVSAQITRSLVALATYPNRLDLPPTATNLTACPALLRSLTQTPTGHAVMQRGARSTPTSAGSWASTTQSTSGRWRRTSCNRRRCAGAGRRRAEREGRGWGAQARRLLGCQSTRSQASEATHTNLLVAGTGMRAMAGHRCCCHFEWLYGWVFMSMLPERARRQQPGAHETALDCVKGAPLCLWRCVCFLTRHVLHPDVPPPPQAGGGATGARS